MTTPRIRREESTIFVEGAVTFATAAGVQKALQQALQPQPGAIDGNQAGFVVDCRAMVNSDSSALSLLVTAARIAAAQRRTLQVVGLGDQLASLARVYGVDFLLGEELAVSS